jgi:hypothetical protein
VRAVGLVESVALTVKPLVPRVVGVPERRPPDDRVMPDGSDPLTTLNEYGATPPLAVTS